jgi:Ni,Fe-hydrogenase III large subunit
MGVLAGITEGARPATSHRPWPRWDVTAEGWAGAAEALGAGRLCLLGLWGEVDRISGRVHMAVAAEDPWTPAVLTLACPEGTFPSVARLHPPAGRLERAAHDLFGLTPEGAPDRRPWLDHGRWPTSAPLGAAPKAPRAPGYVFLPAEGESLHQIPVGPVHAGIIEPGHFRFTASGETVVRLEARLGYVHKGIEGLLAGKSPADSARVAGRVSGDSTVACQVAFARAVEAALEAEAPPRAQSLRGVMAELERVANHLGDVGAICNDAAFALLHAHCGILREQVLRACGTAFGHRLMMDRVVPGGVAADLEADGAAVLRDAAAEVRRRFPELVEIYDATASIQDRTVGTGRVSGELVRRYAAGGYVGRASGRAFDARVGPGYPPYTGLELAPAVRHEGDVNARVWVRIREIETSLDLIERLLADLPDGPVAAGLATDLAAVGPDGAEGVALVEGFRGDVLAWVRLAPDGTVARCHLRDPSWFQWPLLEAAIEGNIVADFPLCNKSFNGSYAGADL